MKKPDATLAKADTVALWHAVRWMESVVSEWRCEGFKDEQDRAQYDGQHQSLVQAKRALRKVNAIRKAQATHKRDRSASLPVAEIVRAVGAGPNDVSIRWRGGLPQMGALLYTKPAEELRTRRRPPSSAGAPEPPPGWQPTFDFMSPSQEALAIQFCQEISGRRGEAGSPPDPVRLLEMAQALYQAERQDAPISDEGCRLNGKLQAERKAAGGSEP